MPHHLMGMKMINLQRAEIKHTQKIQSEKNDVVVYSMLQNETQ